MTIERPEPVRQLLLAFGARLRELRRTSGETAAGLYRRCGIDMTYLHRLERGEIDPRLSMLSKLASALNVPLQEVLPQPSAPAYDAAVPAEAPAGTEASQPAGLSGSPERGHQPRPVDPSAAAGETAAYREAIEAFQRLYTKRANEVGLAYLVETTHVHRAIVLDEPRGRALVVTFNIAFSNVLEISQLSELIAHAKSAPGTVPEA